MSYRDVVIKCDNCGQDFVWTSGEREFFETKGLNKPEHCMICRSVMKNAQADLFRGAVVNRKKK